LATARHVEELTQPCEERFLKLHACGNERLNFDSAFARHGQKNLVSRIHEFDPCARRDVLYGVRIFSPFSIHVRFSLDAP
jgi:hypothetical protein